MSALRYGTRKDDLQVQTDSTIPNTPSEDTQIAPQSTESDVSCENESDSILNYDDAPRASRCVAEHLELYRPASRTHIRASVKRRVIERDGGYCVYCDFPADSVGHVVPWAFGGNHDEDNLVASCMVCNLRVSDKVFDTFRDKQQWIRDSYGPNMRERVRIARRSLHVCADCQQVFRPGLMGASNVLCAECYAKDDRKHQRRMNSFEH